MGAQEPRRLTDLPVVALTDEREGHHTIGVLLEGAFVPIAQHVDGLVEAVKRRWSDLGGLVADAPAAARESGLETRLAQLETTVQLLQARVDQVAPAGQQQPPDQQPPPGQ